MRALAALTATAALSSSAFAIITNVTGSATVAPIPPSLTIGAFESNEQARIMFERNRLLPEAQEVDITATGLVDQLSDLTPGAIPAGTAVSSYILHADSVGITTRTYEGSVTFSDDILGIIVGSNRLINTDARFGRDGTAYWNGTSRGLDLGANPGTETLFLSVNRNTVAFRLTVGEGMDEVRVLTAIPSPGALALAGLAASTGLRRRRFAR
ncbi:MAG: hypothetical protein ACOYN0_10580 [Phycisphaerales bacterium]